MAGKWYREDSGLGNGTSNKDVVHRQDAPMVCKKKRRTRVSNASFDYNFCSAYGKRGLCQRRHQTIGLARTMEASLNVYTEYVYIENGFCSSLHIHNESDDM